MVDVRAQSPECLGVCVANKHDMEASGDRDVSYSEGKEWAAARSLLYFETSSKFDKDLIEDTACGVAVVFDQIVDRLVNRIDRTKKKSVMLNTSSKKCNCFCG